MKFSVAARTDVGRKRKNNEDALWVDTARGFFAVADGMGGHAAGEVAAKEALATAFDALVAGRSVIEGFWHSPSKEASEQVLRLLERAVRTATYMIYGISQIDPDHKGMGTTLSMLLITPAAAFIAHVGDSRIYIIRGRSVRRLTKDHTLVAEMVARGKMTEDEAKASKFSNVLSRAVGAKEFVEVDTQALLYQPGDVFLLCSDGLAGYLADDRDIMSIVDPKDMKNSAERAIGFALSKGGRDNVTAVLVRVDS